MTSSDLPRRHPTQDDVARAAGVSRALVSIVFRELPGASPENRDHVRTVAAELGYVPDGRAQLLGRRRTGILGVTFSLEHDFHTSMIEELYPVAEGAGFDLVLSGFGPRRDEQAAVTALLGYRCEGLLLLGPSSRPAELERIARQLPTVSTFRRTRSADLGSVRADDAKGAELATRHLLELGHRRLVHVDGGRAPGAADRRRGVQRAAQATGVDVHLIAGGSTETDGLRSGAELARLLGRRRSPTAAVVFNDHAAVGVLAAVRQAGATVPGDLSVTGFDDSRLAAVPGVDLTTVRQDLAELAERAIAQLAARLEDPTRAAEHTVIAPTLVVRGTTAPLSA